MRILDFSIGTDIERISRFSKYSQNPSDNFLKRIFTEDEINYCFSHKNPEQHLAVRFSAKEAVYKALSSMNITDVHYCDIEIENDERGVPSVNLLTDEYTNLIFKLSMSHGNGNSLASVIVMKVDK